jgi:hypothetical protein
MNYGFRTGSSNIATTGTITSGTWNATAINDSYISNATSWNAKQNALTFGIANTNSLKIDDIDAALNDYCKLTTSGITGKSYSEVKTDLSLNNVENTALSTWTGSSNINNVGTLADLTVANNILPSINGSFALGSTSYRFSDLKVNSIDMDGNGTCVLDGGVTDKMLYLRSNSDTSGFEWNIAGTSNLQLIDTGVASVFETRTSATLATRQLEPISNGLYNLGSSSYLWNEIFCENATINTSDRNLKTDIKTCSLGLDFIYKLNPVEYKWKNKGKRTHYGLISQEVGEIVNKDQCAIYIDGKYLEDKQRKIRKECFEKKQMLNEKLAKEKNKPFIKQEYNDDDPNKNQHLLGIRYQELISPLIKAIQDLKNIVNDQQKQINELKNIILQNNQNKTEKNINKNKKILF